MRGTRRKISLPRRFIIDFMHASMRVPAISFSRSIDVGPYLEARAKAATRPGWAAAFIKAFALVAKEEPALRTLYVKLPWPHFFEIPHSIAMVAVARSAVDGVTKTIRSASAQWRMLSVTRTDSGSVTPAMSSVFSREFSRRAARAALWLQRQIFRLSCAHNHASAVPQLPAPMIAVFANLIFVCNVARFRELIVQCSSDVEI